MSKFNLILDISRDVSPLASWLSPRLYLLHPPLFYCQPAFCIWNLYITLFPTIIGRHSPYFILSHRPSSCHGYLFYAKSAATILNIYRRWATNVYKMRGRITRTRLALGSEMMSCEYVHSERKQCRGGGSETSIYRVGQRHSWDMISTRFSDDQVRAHSKQWLWDDRCEVQRQWNTYVFQQHVIQ